MDVRFLYGVAALAPPGVAKGMMYRSMGHPYAAAAAGSMFGSLTSPTFGFYNHKDYQGTPHLVSGGIGSGTGGPVGSHPSLSPVASSSVAFSIDCLLTASERSCSPIMSMASGRCSSAGTLRLRRHSGSCLDKSGKRQHSL